MSHGTRHRLHSPSAGGHEPCPRTIAVLFAVRIAAYPALFAPKTAPEPPYSGPRAR
ncbi:hypothetical protein SGM_1505 [Streptomyces griseoaurantiacus M045]|uniref:Uncharacterized protein n=1 Tax=Streptomyces griseoaurantiacus M045 TaxID=996637 RepID=F3NEE1_9ACTN|nr:hypothetical protein SGM_1505 [Streptomyces griseoaurantiacus M045]